jgi:hypothetical protein
MPKRLAWRAAQFDMLRLRLFERATRVVALKTNANSGRLPGPWLDLP